MMTLRNSLAISILCHILIFGCALALARFAGNVMRQGSDVIQVALVAPGNLEKDARTAQKKKAESVARVAHDHMTVEEHTPAPPVEIGSNKPLPQPSDNAADEADTGPPTNDPDAGKIGGPQTGQASAEYLGLVDAIERAKKYPRLARERGMEGVVRLRFMLNRSGGVDAVELVKSSGYEILDSASINAIYRAAPMPYVNGWVEMPMRYVLK